jgi:choline dehydrogenase-like flavoprotein
MGETIIDSCCPSKNQLSMLPWTVNPNGGSQVRVATADVLIIGGGLSGAVVARRLAEANVSVVCLEQGDRCNPTDYIGKDPDWELVGLKQWHASPNVRSGVADYPIEESNSDITPLTFNAVGGSTILYGAHWTRFLASDFYARSLDDVGDDWPLDYWDLAPFYDRVEVDFGVSGIAGDPAYPPKSDYPLPPLPIGAAGAKVAKAHNALGWHWWPGANAIASRPYQGRRPCVQRGTCAYGCSEGAKASVDITHWPIAERLGVRVITGARVRAITTGSTGHADGAVYFDRSGKEHHQGASIVIVAAGAIGTPRLLLLSDSAQSSDGLANSSGLVGKRLMMHPFTRVVGFFDEYLRSWQGHWGQSIISMEFAETDLSRGFIRGAKWNLGPSGGPLGAALFPWPGEPRWGEAIHDHVAKWVGRSAIWGISAEDLPEESNAVTLDRELQDSDGIPAPKVTYRVANNSKALLGWNVKRAIESMAAAGAYETVSLPLMREFGWHPLGTCRMGDDPSTSVVDKWGRTHDVPNLFIVDGSTFVTSSSVNPAATISALALRAAEHILEKRRSA